jgi:hypothetical protein
MRPARHLAVLALAAALCGCERYFSDFYVENRSGSTLKDVKLHYGDRTAVLGDIANGGVLRFSDGVYGEGAINLSFVLEGTATRYEGCYYTFTSPPRGRLIVHKGSLERKCKN